MGGKKRKKLQHANTVEPCAEVKGTDNFNSNKAKKNTCVSFNTTDSDF